jgi:hypothetical protein
MAEVTKLPTSAAGLEALAFPLLSHISCDFPLIIIIIIIIIILITRLVRLGSCSEIDDSQRGREVLNTEFEGSTELVAATGQRLVKTWQTERLITSCSELASVWIGDSAAAAGSCELQTSNKRSCRSKPRLHSVTHAHYNNSASK